MILKFGPILDFEAAEDQVVAVDRAGVVAEAI